MNLCTFLAIISVISLGINIIMLIEISARGKTINYNVDCINNLVAREMKLSKQLFQCGILTYEMLRILETDEGGDETIKVTIKKAREVIEILQ